MERPEALARLGEPLTSTELSRLVERNLGSGSRAEELVAYDRADADARAVVALRLRAMDWLLHASGGSAADRAAAASAMGTGVSNVRRLKDRMAAAGPIRGLLPGYRAVTRSAPRREGIGEPVDGWVKEKLRASPRARTSEVAAYVALLAAARTRAGMPTKVPATSTLYRRVHALRGAGGLPAALPYGASVLIDQVALDAPFAGEQGEVRPVLTLVIDRGTAIVVGHSLRHGRGTGLDEAVNMAPAVMRDLEFEGLLAVSILEDLEIVAPDDRDDLDEVAETVRTATRGRTRVIVKGGAGSVRGRRLAGIMGDRIGSHRFRMATPNLLDTERPLDPETARSLRILRADVVAALRSWNADRLPAARGAGGGAMRRDRIDPHDAMEVLSILSAQLLYRTGS